MANSLCSLHFVRRLPFYLRQVSYGRRQSFFGHWRSSLFLRRCSSCGRCCGVWFRLQLLLEVLSVVVPSCSKVLQSWLWSAVLVEFGIGRCVVVLVVLGIFCILVIGVGVGWVSEGGCRFPLLACFMPCFPTLDFSPFLVLLFLRRHPGAGHSHN